MHSIFPKRRSDIGLFGLLLIGLLIAGCDSGTDGSNTVLISGRVTSAQSYGANDAASVEGATVTANRINNDGSTTSFSGADTSDAEGRFTLQVQNPSSVILLEAADESGFASSQLVYVTSNEFEVPPMTVESEVEGEVFLSGLETNSQETPAPGVASVAVHVSGDLAAAVDTGASANEVAQALSAATRTEATFFGNQRAAYQAVLKEKLNLYLALQQGLAGSSDDAEALIHEYQQAIATVYANGANVSVESQAHLRLAVLQVLLTNSTDLNAEARLALKKRAEILAAFTTTQVVEVTFDEGTLADAGETLIADLRAATSSEEIAIAKDDYEDAVKAQLEAAFGIGGTIYNTVSTTADVALTDLLATASSTDAIVEAYATFFSDTTAEIVSALEDNDVTEAEAGARVIILMSAFLNAG